MHVTRVENSDTKRVSLFGTPGRFLCAFSLLEPDLFVSRLDFVLGYFFLSVMILVVNIMYDLLRIECEC